VIKFFAISGRVIPEWGILAYAPSPNLITVVLDPSCPRFKDQDGETRFSAVIAHECHHVCRHGGPGYGETLGEQLVSEGLAITFEEECGYPIFPEYAASRSEANIHDLTTLALPLLNCLPDQNRQFNVVHDGHEKSFPSWGIYALGPIISGTFLSVRHLAPSQAANIDAQEVLRTWKDTIIQPITDRPTRLHLDRGNSDQLDYL
jgi:uncharacterized protein YjaZ